jgi:hypothetical protein
VGFKLTTLVVIGTDCIGFVSDLQQVSGFLWVLQFSPPIKLKVLKYHTVRTVLKYHTVRTVLKYHTVRTVLKYHTVRTVLKVWYFRTVLSVVF